MKKLLIITGAIAISAALVNCSKTDDTAATPLTAGGLAFQAVTAALNGAEGLAPAPAAAMVAASNGDVVATAGGLNAFWSTDAFMPNPKYDGSPECAAYNVSVTLKDYMGTQFDDAQKRCNGSAINVFGRIKQSAGVLCVLMNSLSATTSASLAAAAPVTVTLDTATKARLGSLCPDIDLTDSSIPASVTFTFAAPGITTNYDLKVTISPFNEVVLMKYGTGTVINFASSEDNDNGRTRTLIAYDSATGLLKAEYVSKSKGVDFPLYVHRLYKDETNNIGRVFSSIQSGFTTDTDTTPTNVHDYIVSGQPNGGTVLGFSTSLTGYSGHNSAFEACVTSGNISTDGPALTGNAFSCTVPANSSFATAEANIINAPSSGAAIMTGTTAVGPTWQVLSSGSEAILWTTRDNMLTTGW